MCDFSSHSFVSRCLVYWYVLGKRYSPHGHCRDDLNRLGRGYGGSSEKGQGRRQGQGQGFVDDKPIRGLCGKVNQACYSEVLRFFILISSETGETPLEYIVLHLYQESRFFKRKN